MRWLFLLLYLSSSGLAVATEIDVEKHCSEDSKLLIMSAWEAYPRDRRERKGDPVESLQLLEKAVGKSPECQWALRHLSTLNIEMNNIDQAKKYNKILLELYPVDPVAIDDRSALLTLEGKYEEAIKLLEEVINQNGPGNGALYYSIAMTYAQQKKNEKALDYLESSAEINPGWLNEQNAQADDEFVSVVKEKRFHALLRMYLKEAYPVAQLQL